MKFLNAPKITFFLFTLATVISCGKEEVLPPDNLIGQWNVYSITDTSGSVIVWDELVADLVNLIPTYSCMEFTASVTEQLVTTRYVLADENSTACKSPIVSAYTWLVDTDSGNYYFTQGNITNEYLISFSNSNNRMTWVDQTNGTITVWDREQQTTTTE